MLGIYTLRMIKPADWIIFLDNGASLEELPVPAEHLKFCMDYLKPKSNVTKENRFGPLPVIKARSASLTELVNALEASGKYPPVQRRRLRPPYI